MTFPSEHDFALLLFQLFSILCLAATFGELLRRWGYPSVIGEILTGIILGPSVLGHFWPAGAAALFPVAHTRYLGSLAWLGSVFLLLLAGTEVDLVVLRKERRVVLWTSLLGIVIPYAFGFALGLRLPDHYLVTPENRTVFALLLATTLSISAIPVVAKILMDLRLLKTSVGQTIIGSAVVNDFVGWIFFAVLLSLITGGPGHETSVAGIVALTLGEPPGETTHWTGRVMAKAAGVSLTSVQRIWRAHGLAPHRIRTFKLSNDPKFAAKVRDIVGLYVDPPAHAVVLSVDEKSQIQALDRTQPGLPLKKGRAGTMTHDYKRNGTTTLFAAFDVLEGKVIGRCMQRHRHQEFIRFLNAIEREVPAGKTVHASSTTTPLTSTPR